MKRFVTDVQELWLTNLEHLKEHDPKNSGQKYDNDKSEGGESGLSNRRDVKAIESMHCQIQSVSQKRAFERAYHTARLPPVMVMLDYTVPATYPSTPFNNKGVNFIYPLPPVMESLIDHIHMAAAVTDGGRRVASTAVLLHIDRLLPSLEFRTCGAQSEVLWRFSVWRGDGQLASSCFVCREADVSQYIAEGILRKNEEENRTRGHFTPQSAGADIADGSFSTATGSDPSLKKSQLVFVLDDSKLSADEAPLQLPWMNSPQLPKQPIPYLTVSVLGFRQASYHKMALEGDDVSSVKIGVCADLADEQGSRVFLECSPAELRRLLNVPPHRMPLDDYSWWTHAERSKDLWPQFVLKLALQESDEDATSAAALALKFDKSEQGALAERIDGALSSQEALFCAYELLECITVSEDATSTHLSIQLQQMDSERMFVNCASAVGDMTADPQPFQVPYPPPSSTQDNISFANYLVAEVAPTIVKGHQWEQISMHSGVLSPSASMLASGALSTVTQVPGANEIGRKGLWFANQSNKPPCEFTRAAARFFRDSRISTTDSVLVNLTLVLDSSLIFPTMLAWEDYSTQPIAAPGEEVLPIIPMLCNRGIGGPLTLLKTALDSPLSSRSSPPIVIFSTTPQEGSDYVPLETFQAFTSPSRVAKRLPIQQSEQRKQKRKQLAGLRRYVPFRNVNGFQEQVCVKLLGVDPVLSTVVFGITRLGAQPNSMGVNNRNIWHSTLPIIENINRPRVPKDYHYIVARLQSSGMNQPTSYTTRMEAAECVGLRSSAFTEYEDKYKAIQELRDTYNKQVALEERIQKVEADLRTKQLMHKAYVQNEMQRKVEKKLRKATKSEVGWRMRCLRHSSLVELQGNWERRRDDRTGAYFFHRILPSSSMYQPPVNAKVASLQQDKEKEKFAETCQWEVPAEWDGDPLAAPGEDLAGGGGSFFASTAVSEDDFLSFGSSSQGSLKKENFNGGGAFDDPPDSWLPAPTSSSQIKPLNEQKVVPLAMQAINNPPSDRALKSVTERSASTIDTVRLEHIAEQLVSSDELMRVIARRLGLSEQQVVPADDLYSVFSNKPSQQLATIAEEQQPMDPMAAPRDEWLDDLHEPDFDSDDDLWSDEEQEVGDNESEPDLHRMPTSLKDAAALRRQEYRDKRSKLGKSTSHLRDVPQLNLHQSKQGEVGDEVGLQREDEFGWRRLPRPVMRPGFLSRLGADQTHTQGPDTVSSNTLNSPLFLMPISPVDACKYAPEEFLMQIESIFIPDVKKDMERAIATVERNIKREEELQHKMPTDDLLLFGEAKEFTSADALIARQQQEDKRAVSDPLEEAQERAILAAKSSNIAQMEDALAAEIPVNTSDPYGNSLLILAAQQGSKRMCKFLLRRGANINQQSMAGNTALHFCYVKGQADLAEYLKSKGADDTIINADGLTCYEGISLDSMKQMFGEEADLAD